MRSSISWRRSEEIFDLVKKSKEGHTAGDARVLSMASEWVSSIATGAFGRRGGHRELRAFDGCD